MQCRATFHVIQLPAGAVRRSCAEVEDW